MITTKFMKNLEKNVDACYYIFENKLELCDDILYEDGVAIFGYFRGEDCISIEVNGYKKYEAHIHRDPELCDYDVCKMIYIICFETLIQTRLLLSEHTITKEQMKLIYKARIKHELGPYLSSNMTPNKNEVDWSDLD